MGQEPFKTTVPGIVFFGVVSSLIAAVIWKYSTSEPALKGPTLQAATLPATYQRRLCDDRKVIDFSGKNPEKLVFPLHEGCYGDRIVLPLAWQNFEVALSGNPGDFMSVWCDQEPNPRRLVIYPGATDGTLTDCPAGRANAAFSLEGKGKLTLVRTKNKETAIPEEPQGPKMDPIAPSSGADPEESLVVDECHRAGDQVRCSAKITNNTDAPRNTYLRDSSAVDDEGNSFFIGSFGGGISFASEAGFGGVNQRLMPGVPTKFYVTVNDAHRNVKKINLQISADWTGGARYATLIFNDVPVQ